MHAAVVLQLLFLPQAMARKPRGRDAEQIPHKVWAAVLHAGHL